MQVVIIEKECQHNTEGVSEYTWTVSITTRGKEARDLFLATDDLLSFAKFKRASFEQANTLPPHHTNAEWHKVVQDAITVFDGAAERIEPNAWAVVTDVE